MCIRDSTEVVARFCTLGLVASGCAEVDERLLRAVFVERHQWLPAAEFAELQGLVAVLPGCPLAQMAAALGATKVRAAVAYYRGPEQY